MKFGVVIFPGSNCDADTIHVLRDIYEQEVVSLWHKDNDLQSCDFIVIPGGSLTGIISAPERLHAFLPIMASVSDYAEQGGYVLGIM